MRVTKLSVFLLVTSLVVWADLSESLPMRTDVLCTTADYQLRRYEESVWVGTHVDVNNSPKVDASMQLLKGYTRGENSAGLRMKSNGKFLISFSGDGNIAMLLMIPEKLWKNPPTPTSSKTFITRLPTMDVLTRRIKGDVMKQAHDFSRTLTEQKVKFNNSFFFVSFSERYNKRSADASTSSLSSNNFNWNSKIPNPFSHRWGYGKRSVDQSGEAASSGGYNKRSADASKSRGSSNKNRRGKKIQRPYLLPVFLGLRSVDQSGEAAPSGGYNERSADESMISNSPNRYSRGIKLRPPTHAFQWYNERSADESMISNSPNRYSRSIKLRPPTHAFQRVYGKRSVDQSGEAPFSEGYNERSADESMISNSPNRYSRSNKNRHPPPPFQGRLHKRSVQHFGEVPFSGGYNERSADESMSSNSPERYSRSSRHFGPDRGKAKRSVDQSGEAAPSGGYNKRSADESSNRYSRSSMTRRPLTPFQWMIGKRSVDQSGEAASRGGYNKRSADESMSSNSPNRYSRSSKHSPPPPPFAWIIGKRSVDQSGEAAPSGGYNERSADERMSSNSPNRYSRSSKHFRPHREEVWFVATGRLDCPHH